MTVIENSSEICLGINTTKGEGVMSGFRFLLGVLEVTTHLCECMLDVTPFNLYNEPIIKGYICYHNKNQRNSLIFIQMHLF